MAQLGRLVEYNGAQRSVPAADCADCRHMARVSKTMPAYAAHIESRVFNGIGREEVEVGIELTTEVLKAVYQYSELLQRLRGLKQPGTT